MTNFGTSTLDLSGAVLSGGVYFVFPAPSSLGAGQRTLLVGNIAAFRLRYGATPPVGGYFTGNLDNTGESLQLVDKVGEKVLDFTYDGKWHPVAIDRPPGNSQRSIAWRHKKGANVVFFDHHGEWVPKDRLYNRDASGNLVRNDKIWNVMD